MIDLKLLAQWLSAVPTELSLQFEAGSRKPEFQQADRIGLVTGLAGTGLTLEGAGDAGSFQIKVVAREFEDAGLRRSAFQIDQALVFGDYPADLWGTYVQYVERSAGQPESLQEDELDRVSYTCTYIAHETPER